MNDPRLALLIEAAREAGILVTVSKRAARCWRGEWMRAKRAVLAECPRPLRSTRRRSGRVRLSRSPLLSELPPPGTWINFRPHPTSQPVPYLVIALIPPGVPLAAVLTPEQMALLAPTVRPEPFLRGPRVALGVPGGMHLISSIRTSLAGAVAARGEVIPDPTVVSPHRLASPLSPGTSTSWSWHSSFGQSEASGVIVAYLPGGSAITDVVPGTRIAYGLRNRSEQDRYLVRLSAPRQKRLMTPAAHLVERHHLHPEEPECLSAS